MVVSKVQAKCLAGYSVSVWRAWQVFGGRLRECVQVSRECLALGLNRGQNFAWNSPVPNVYASGYLSEEYSAYNA